MNYSYYETGSLSNLAQQNPSATGIAARVDSSSRKREGNYAIVFDGFINIPTDGGYTFTSLARDEARLEIDSVPVAASPKPFAQVCGSVGNAMQASTGSLGLRAGRHAIRVQMTHTTGPSDFAVK